ncbi:MAG: IS630 transposase-related protein, partial [Kiritimatiellaeota bacterium]|nr:IS630 transposase-related protein [Kiritimatiellota bacterium]
MKAYSLDLRQRVVAFVRNGGKKTEAAHRFGVGRNTVYRFLQADKSQALAPKTSWGRWRKLDPRRLG